MGKVLRLLQKDQQAYFCDKWPFIHRWLYSSLLGLGLFFSFVIFFSTQTVELLGRVINPSQCRYLNTGQHKHRINAHRDVHALSGGKRQYQLHKYRSQLMVMLIYYCYSIFIKTSSSGGLGRSAFSHSELISKYETYRQSVGPPRWGTSSSQDRYIHRTKHEHRNNVRIRNHDPRVRSGKDVSCLRRQGYCDRLHYKLCPSCSFFFFI
jgi:hypothetical protein